MANRPWRAVRCRGTEGFWRALLCWMTSCLRRAERLWMTGNVWLAVRRWVAFAHWRAHLSRLTEYPWLRNSGRLTRRVRCCRHVAPRELLACDAKQMHLMLFIHGVHWRSSAPTCADNPWRGRQPRSLD